MIKNVLKILETILHPVLIPTLGFILLFNSGFYFSFLAWEAKRFVLLVVFFSTCILPLLSVAILALNPKFDITMTNRKERILPLLFSLISYYLGYMLLDKISAYPVFKVLMLASVIVISGLLIVSVKWDISAQMASIGGLSGTVFSLSFRTGINPVWAILLVVIVSGLTGSLNLLNAKYNIWQVLGGYLLGFVVIYLIIYLA